VDARNSLLIKFLQGCKAIYNDEDPGNHLHDWDEMEYISALYRAKMFFAAEDELEETYANLHEKVMQAMGCVLCCSCLMCC
jgi:hypothetical protein